MALAHGAEWQALPRSVRTNPIRPFPGLASSRPIRARSHYLSMGCFGHRRLGPGGRFAREVVGSADARQILAAHLDHPEASRLRLERPASTTTRIVALEPRRWEVVVLVADADLPEDITASAVIELPRRPVLGAVSLEQGMYDERHPLEGRCETRSDVRRSAAAMDALRAGSGPM